MDGVTLTPLKKIFSPKGDVYHAIKASDNGFNGFGEAYFSSVSKDNIKGWKKHLEMTLNLIVPIGIVKVVIYDEIKDLFFTVELSKNNYQRLTIKPGLWVAFKGLDTDNIMLNVASIEHDPTESITNKLEDIKYEW